MKLLLTDIGANLASEGFITGAFPKITKVKIGDGGGSSVEHKIEDTNLVNVVYEAPIISGSRERTTLNIVVNIPVNIGGFTVREIGCFNDDDQMIAVSHVVEWYKPGMDEDPTDTTIHLRISFSSTQSVDVAFSYDDVYVKQSELNDILDQIDNLRNSGISMIMTPIITAPSTGVIDPNDVFISSPYETYDTYKGFLEEVVWELSNNIAFQNILESVSFTSVTPYKPGISLDPITDYYIRVRYISDSHKSRWSEIVSFTTPETGLEPDPIDPDPVDPDPVDPDLDLGDDGLNTLLAGNNIDGGYYGEVVHGMLVDNRDYRGDHRSGTKYKKDQQVFHSGKLWRSLIDNNNQTPITGSSVWEIDVRNGLPTGKWLLDNVGVAYGVTDSNNDGLSSGSTSIGALKNITSGWLKFVKDKKLLYVAKKPFCDTISWNDLAKRDLVYGNRTIRIGHRLYYIRLLTAVEYTALLGGMVNGVLGSIPETELSLADKTYIEDKQKTTTRKAMQSIDTISDIASKNRTGSYRPVLELIEDGKEPYNNLPICPLATNENFQYDKYTDTGFFGEVPHDSLINGTNLANAIGLTAGTNQHSTAGWLKFYWHGQIKYVSKRTYKNNLSWDNIFNANAVYGVDLGNTALKEIIVANNTYSVGLLSGVGKSIADDAQYWTNADFSKNVALELGRGSQWNELMYRVHTQYVDDVLANQGGTAGNEPYTGGVQIGNNWANYTDSDLTINYGVAGNGTATWCQEASAYYVSSRMYRGISRLASLTWYDRAVVATSVGWRPSLTLKQ